MYKSESFEIPIYFGKVVVILTSDLINIKDTYNLDEKVKNYDAATFRYNDDYIVAFNSKELTNSIISHEIVHLVNMVFHDRFIELDMNNDEPQAYLHSYLFKQIETILNKLK